MRERDIRRRWVEGTASCLRGRVKLVRRYTMLNSREGEPLLSTDLGESAHLNNLEPVEKFLMIAMVVSGIIGDMMGPNANRQRGLTNRSAILTLEPDTN